MRADGSNVHAITQPRLEGFAPGWSPDGGRITFTSNCCRLGKNAYSINANGTGLQKLTNDVFPYDTSTSTFSPTGGRMAFASDRRYSDLCCADLFEMKPSGTDQTLIDTGLLGVEDIAWGTAPPIAADSTMTPRLPVPSSAPAASAKCRDAPRGDLLGCLQPAEVNNAEGKYAQSQAGEVSKDCRASGHRQTLCARASCLWTYRGRCRDRTYDLRLVRARGKVLVDGLALDKTYLTSSVGYRRVTLSCYASVTQRLVDVGVR